MVDRKESNTTLKMNGLKALPSACDNPQCTHHESPIFFDKKNDPFFFDPERPCANCGTHMMNNIYRNQRREARGETKVPYFACRGAQDDTECKKHTQWSLNIKQPTATREEAEQDAPSKDQFFGPIVKGLKSMAVNCKDTNGTVQPQVLKDTLETVQQFETYQARLSTRTHKGFAATDMDAETSVKLAVKSLTAISEAAAEMAFGVIQCNEEVVNVASAVDVVKKHFQDMHDLIGGHDNAMTENHDDEVQMMGDDDGGGDNNCLDNVKGFDNEASDEMPKNGHRHGYRSSKRGPCTDNEDDEDQDAHECGTPKKTLRLEKEDS